MIYLVLTMLMVLVAINLTVIRGGTVLVLIENYQISDRFGVMELGRIGWSDAFMIYLPAVGLAIIVG